MCGIGGIDGVGFFWGRHHRGAVLAERLEECRRRIAAAAERAGRSSEDVTLVAVTKQRRVEELREAYALGVRDFAENRPDELLEKMAQLPDDVRWHFVGPLQGNRVRRLHERLALLHSFDRVDLAPRWADAPGAAPVLLQVNVAGEAQKRGVMPDEVEGALDALERAGVRCVGLTVMPPAAERPEESAPWFARGRELRDRLLETHPSLVELSMGTSQDYETALEQGATFVRLGNALFGQRPVSE